MAGQLTERSHAVWPTGFWARALVALPFLVLANLAGWLLATLLGQWPWPDALVWLALFGPVTVLVGAVAIAGAAQPGTRVRLWPVPRGLTQRRA
ncbi:hypothetical protein PCC79_02030 [Propioniciclava soli]|uniref:DUF4175 domain-containing protein n=1 Tax=Propioniciclava soli TaxID=2775081 RepID=A0ABZ3C9Y4_9ACTN